MSLGSNLGQMQSMSRKSRGIVSLYLYLSLSFVSILLEYSNSNIPNTMRAYAMDVATPVLAFLAEPIRVTQDGIVRLAGVGDIYQTARRLEIENEDLQEWREVARQLTVENTRLREMLKAPGREVPILASGQIIGIGGGAFERSIVINLGTQDKVIRDLPVTTQDGVIGRTITVGHNSSRVLLITDLNSRIPVRNNRTGALAVLSGRNDAVLTLDFLPVNADTKVGDRLVTSGHGGMFPADLPIGIVTEVSEHIISVEPVALLGKLNWVRVMEYRPVLPEAETVNENEVKDTPAVTPENTEDAA